MSSKAQATRQPAKGRQEGRVETVTKDDVGKLDVGRLEAKNDQDQGPAAAGQLTGQEVALRPSKNELPTTLTTLQEMMEADAGKGVSQDAADSIVPIIRILQTNTPEAKPADPMYISGAKPGDIFIKATGEIIDGEKDGIVVQPCWYGHFWNEWVPRHKGGGFVAQHADLPDDVEEYVDDQDRKKLRRKSNKNEIIETRVHAVIMDGAPYILSLSSTGHTVSRTWTAMINSFKLPSGKPQSAWVHRYRIKTVHRVNPAGDWYQFRVEHLAPIQTIVEYEAGKKLFEDMSSGEKTIEADRGDDTGDGEAKSDVM